MDSIFSTLASSWTIRVIFATAVAFVLRTLYQTATDPLLKVPGPWLARLTRLWELQRIRDDHFEQVNIDLHKQYGSVVRVSPNRYSISSPDHVQTIYGHGTKFTKDRWYRAFGHPDDAHADIFSVMDERRHSANRRKVSSLYSMTGLMPYEPYVDSCIRTLVEKLTGFASKDEPGVSITDWMQFYAFDVVGEITVGEPFGMMQKGADIEGILDTIHKSLHYSSRMSLFAELHAWLGRLNHALGTRSDFENINAYVRRHLAAHQEGGADGSRYAKSARPDFIQTLLSLQDTGRIDAEDVFNTININIAAGSDTTGLTLSAAIYYLTRNPGCVKQLRAEIDARVSQGELSSPVTFNQAQNMPYLQAIFKETFRLHPAVGLPLARITPPEGQWLDGYFFPGGTVVGINAWVIHRDKNIFGDDADKFRPERWLEKERDIARMDRHLFTFGAGSRTCIGKNFTLMAMTKVLPELFRQFDFEIKDNWETQNVFFVKPQHTCSIILRNDG